MSDENELDAVADDLLETRLQLTRELTRGEKTILVEAEYQIRRVATTLEQARAEASQMETAVDPDDLDVDQPVGERED